jgi:ATP-dependent RNA helicase DeaD
VVLAPTRELGLQIASDLAKFAKYQKKARTLAVYGGSSIGDQIRDLAKKPVILIATPGRLLDLMERKKADLSAVRTVVLDEADEMLKMGFKDDLDAILSGTPAEKRVLLFSATMPHEIVRIAGNYMKNPETVKSGKTNQAQMLVKHICFPVREKNRYPVLKRIVDADPGMYGIIFCRTKILTQEIADQLLQDGYNADALHGDLSQAQRDFVMNKFRKRHVSLLVATDVAARGLDVNDLTHVIHYELPDDPEVYIHRSGRTGRAGKEGIAVSIVLPRDAFSLSRMEKRLNLRIDREKVPTGRDIIAKKLHAFAGELLNPPENEDQLADLLPAVYERLQDLSKEDLIARIFSREMKSQLEYYKKNPDIPMMASDKPRTDPWTSRKKFDRSESGHPSNYPHFPREKKSHFHKEREPQGDQVRLVFHAGRKDGLTVPMLISHVNASMGGRYTPLGRITLEKAVTLIEVPADSVSLLQKAMTQTPFRGRRVETEIVSE